MPLFQKPMTMFAEFFSKLTKSERRLARSLTTPEKVQAFLDRIPYSTTPDYRCPLQVVHDRVAHCFDGALFAAAIVRRLGHEPLIMDLLPNKRDDDHILALYKVGGHWGALAKSNFSGLRYREPVFKTLRELVLSYFENFYNVKGEKTLRAYLSPLNLKAFDRYRWMTDNDSLIRIEKRLFAMRPIPILNKSMIARLARVDNRSYRAGMLGADAAGLYRP